MEEEIVGFSEGIGVLGMVGTGGSLGKGGRGRDIHTDTQVN